MPGFEAVEQGDGIEYGILIYDVPQDSPQLYNKILSRIRKRAIRMNLSVYLFQWSMKESMEEIVKQAQAETGQYAAVVVLPFDNRSVDEVRNIATKSLCVEIKKIGKRLMETIAASRSKLAEEGKDFKHVREAYATQIKRRLEEANGLAVMFGLSQDIRHAMDSTKRIFSIQLEAIANARKLRREEKRAAKSEVS